MTPQGSWNRDSYKSCVSSRCWWYTPYDGATWNEYVASDDELRSIVGMEQDLAPVPDWARRVAERSINGMPPCGHYLFPKPFLIVVGEIGAETPVRFLPGCFCAEPRRCEEVGDYCLCLEGWLKGEAPEVIAAELARAACRPIDWSAVCRDLWSVLGEHGELKDRLVERVLLNARLAIHSAAWEDDDLHGDAQPPGAERATPPDASELEARVRMLDELLADTCPEWERMRAGILEWWLCAPKSCRFLERILWAVGKERPPQLEDVVPGYLRCEDTYPNQDEATAWWGEFCAALDGWWRGTPRSGTVAGDVNRRLGKSTPVKRWLVRLLLRKLRLLEENDEQLTRLVRADHGNRRGTSRLA